MPSAHDSDVIDIQSRRACGENLALTFVELEVLRQCERSPGSSLGTDWTWHAAARSLHEQGYLLPISRGYRLTPKGASALEVLRG